MKYLNNIIYGCRFFEVEPGGGTPVIDPPKVDPPANGKELSTDVKDRLEHLEKENKELISARDKAKAATRKAEEDKLIEDGKLKEVIAEKDKIIEEYKPSVEELRNLKQSEIDEAKLVLTPLGLWYDSLANLPTIDLRKMVKTLSAKKPPFNPDGGADGKGIVLTKEEEKRALEMFSTWETQKAFDAFKEMKAKKIIK